MGPSERVFQRREWSRVLVPQRLRAGFGVARLAEFRSLGSRKCRNCERQCLDHDRLDIERCGKRLLVDILGHLLPVRRLDLPQRNHVATAHRLVDPRGDRIEGEVAGLHHGRAERRVKPPVAAVFRLERAEKAQLVEAAQPVCIGQCGARIWRKVEWDRGLSQKRNGLGGSRWGRKPAICPKM